ncbi:MAG: class I SAM-dependent methyltransferase [Thermoplasmata archaeon]|nr:MAG: class I SAM-dependent methyltransferase [Thermoplasmata archaeon]
MFTTTDSELYSFNLKLALKLGSRFQIKTGLKRIASFSYWRSLEEPLVINKLKLVPGDKILDIGSPKTPFLYLATIKQFTIYGTDIQDRTKLLLKNINCLGLNEEYNKGRVKIEKQDARQLSYKDNEFDKIYSISCLEHIENNGDTQAMREIYRTLKKNGRVVITVPFKSEYQESFRDYSFWDKSFEGEKIFYQRHYDLEALKERLIEPSKLKLEKLELYGEPGYRFQNMILMKVPLAVRAGFSIASPLIQKHYIKQLENDQIERAMMACLCLVKR